MTQREGLTFEAVAGDPVAYDDVALAQRDKGLVAIAMNADEVKISPDNTSIFFELSRDVGEMVLVADQGHTINRSTQSKRDEATRRAQKRAMRGGRGAYSTIQEAKIIGPKRVK